MKSNVWKEPLSELAARDWGSFNITIEHSVDMQEHPHDCLAPCNEMYLPLHHDEESLRPFSSQPEGSEWIGDGELWEGADAFWKNLDIFTKRSVEGFEVGQILDED